MSERKSIDQLLQDQPLLWKAGSMADSRGRIIETGHDALDALLPGGGWPASGIMEFILPAWGSGELHLLMPLLQTLAQQGYWVVLLAPPHIPYAPYLNSRNITLERLLVIPQTVSQQDCLWAMEKLLRAKSCGVVLGWPRKISDKLVRRLQLAAEAGQSLGILFRLQQGKTSPAAFRFRLQPRANGLVVEVIKARGGGGWREAEIPW